MGKLFSTSPSAAISSFSNAPRPPARWPSVAIGRPRSQARAASNSSVFAGNIGFHNQSTQFGHAGIKGDELPAATPCPVVRITRCAWLRMPVVAAELLHIASKADFLQP